MSWNCSAKRERGRQDGSTSPAAPSLCARFGLACPRCTRDSLKCSRAGARQKAARGCERPAALQRRASPAGPLMRCPRSIQTVKEAMRQTCEMGLSIRPLTAVPARKQTYASLAACATSAHKPVCLAASFRHGHLLLIYHLRDPSSALLRLCLPFVLCSCLCLCCVPERIILCWWS